MVTDKVGIFDFLVSCPEFNGFVMNGLYNISELAIRKAYSIYTETGEDALAEHAAIKKILWDLPTASLPGEQTVKDFFMNHDEGLVLKIVDRATNWPELIDESAKLRLNALRNNAIFNGIIHRKRRGR